MQKQSILVVDNDIRSQRLIEVSLKRDGYSVQTAVSGADAVEKIKAARPDLIISEVRLPEMDGFEFRRKIRGNAAWADIPFVFLTNQKSIQERIRALELGVEYYLTKPIFIKEIVSLVEVLLSKIEREKIERRDSRQTFTGELASMSLPDIIQSIDTGRKSGVLKISSRGQTGEMYFRDGKIINSVTGKLHGEGAAYRMMLWTEGAFEISFKPVDAQDVIPLSSQGLLVEGMKKIEDYSRIRGSIPSGDVVLDLNLKLLAEKLHDIPDELNPLLRQIDGKSPFGKLSDDAGIEDLSVLGAFAQLLSDGVIFAAAARPRESEAEPATAPAPAPEEHKPAAPEPAVHAQKGIEDTDWGFAVSPGAAHATAGKQVPPPLPQPQKAVVEPKPATFAEAVSLASAVHAPVEPHVPRLSHPPTQEIMAAPPVAPAPAAAPKPAPKPAEEPSRPGPGAEHAVQAELPKKAAPPVEKPTPAAQPVEKPKPVTEPPPVALHPPPIPQPQPQPQLQPSLQLQAPSPHAPIPHASTPPVPQPQPPVEKPRQAAHDPAAAAAAEFFSSLPQEHREHEEAIKALKDEFEASEKTEPSTRIFMIASIALLVVVVALGAFWYFSSQKKHKAETAQQQPAAVQKETAAPEGPPAAEQPSRPVEQQPAAIAEPPQPQPETPPEAAGPQPEAAPIIQAAQQPADTQPKPAVQPAGVDYSKSVAEGRKLYDSGKIKQALAAFEKALKANPAGIEGMVGLGQAYYDLGDLTKAFDACKKAIDLNPQFADAFLLLGTIYYTQGNKIEARKAYENYLLLAPAGKNALEIRQILKSL